MMESACLIAYRNFCLISPISAKCLVNNLHITVPVTLPVDVALLCRFPVLLLLGILCCLAMPDTSSSLVVHESSRIKDRSSPDLIESWKVLISTVSHVDSGLIPVAHVFYLVLRPSQFQSWTVNRGVSMHGT
jgi:hypothetical protein